MIVKYQHNGVWAFIDNIRQVAVDSLDCDDLIAQYDSDEDYAGENDIASGMNGEKLPEEVVNVNKVFLMATNKDWEVPIHSENLLDGESLKNGVYAASILLYVEECKDYEAILLVTNQRCFLMNDKGQTIERLV